MDQFSSSLAAAALVDGQHFTLPGYGTLEGVYVSAQINHIAREVSPPSLGVTSTTPPVPGAQSFAELLVNTGATTQEAVETQEAWLDALERGERIDVGDLGYIELDGETDAMRWVPHRDALARAYYSGDAVEVEPLPPANTDAPEGSAFAKTALAPDDATEDPAAAPAVVRAPESVNGTRKLLRYAALFAAILLGLVALRSVLSEGATCEEEAKAVTISNDRLNRSPLDGAGAGATVLDDEYEAPDYDPALGPATDPPSSAGFDPANLAGPGTRTSSAAAATLGPGTPGPGTPGSAATAPPDDRYADYADDEYVIILGSFRKARYAKALTERLVGDGRLPYVDQKGGLTRVGVTVSTDGVRGALSRELAAARATYGEGAWVLE